MCLFHSSSGGTNGSVTMWRGLVDRCSANDWAMLTSHTCGASGGACVDVLDMDTFAIGSNRVQMRLPGDPTYLCYEPNGELYVSTTAIGGPYSVTSPTDTTHQGVTFTLQRYEGTGAVGVTRRVVFPFGGEPRIVR